MLDFLNLSSNSLTGEIPGQICNLTNLQTLDLSDNQLTGAIPSQLSDLHFLSRFDVSNNQLEGPVPTGGPVSYILKFQLQWESKAMWPYTQPLLHLH
jgi:hypothetical protein